ncbi:CinA family protein [Microbacterium jiangjiandongii]|uniref:CinA family protein n=1 Tax=Microbacterium jiangjiandongii TaxID=3049071 RepID=UPI00214CBA87|nr:CinA family protein [Microbacterium sp. zg.Y843]MCR2814975.1 CinA family protein [Microbacterium sp. zg.Y843]
MIDDLAQAAADRGLWVATAESLTSGLLASRVGAGSGASEWFAGGVVAYRTEVKENLLGLTPGTDPCSAACAEQLATGVRDLMDADLAVSTTGVGGPDPEDGHEPGTVFIGWATRESAGHHALQLEGGPEAVLEATVDAALSQLLAQIDAD